MTRNVQTYSHVESSVQPESRSVMFSVILGYCPHSSSVSYADSWELRCDCPRQSLDF